MLELRNQQLIFKLSAAHLDEGRDWQRTIQQQWQQRQQQRQASQTNKVTPNPVELVSPTGAIGGAFTYTLSVRRGYHLKVRDAITATEREWTAIVPPLDAVVFAVLHESDYQRLYQWYAQSEADAFEDWLQSQLVYQFCDTTLGRITRVLNSTTGVQLDLTDYEGW